MSDDSRPITMLLRRVDDGDADALDELMTLVYSDLERMARRHMQQQLGDRAGRVTIEPAGLVNETFLKMLRQRIQYANRSHFFAIATRLMLQVLIDNRRARTAQKRGGDRGRLTLAIDREFSGHDPEGPENVIEPEALRDAIDELAAAQPRVADVIRMRVVWNFSNAEIATALDVSASTVKSDWRFAQAWLRRSLQTERSDSE